MNQRLHKLAVCGLIAVYGAIACLGHAGLHAVSGHSHAHALDYGAATTPHSGPPHAAAHRHHDHCHHHDHSPADGQHAEHHHAGHDHEPHQHEPLHDEDNCSICQYLAAHGVILTFDATLTTASVAEPARCASSPRLPGAEQFQLPIRGPPALGC